MALIPAKCTQCGANIEVDDTHEAGICQHCGTPFITEKAINNYNISNTVNIQSGGNTINIVSDGGNAEKLLELARRARKLGDVTGANEYYNKALEFLPDNWECAFFAGYFKSSTYKPLDNFSTVNFYTKSTTHAITLIKDDEVDEALSIICPLSEAMADTMISEAERLSKSGGFAVSVNLQLDLHNSKVQAMEIYRVIADNIAAIIKKDDIINDYSVPLWKKYISVGIKQELGYLNFAESSGRDSFVKKLDSYAEKIRQYDTSYVRPKGEHETGACYVATCVYGSYDCPEVWILRRYRDYTLDETWYGRMFIKCYYAISPTIVKWFGSTEWFKIFWKKRLDTIVASLREQGVEDTVYTDKY